MLRERAKKIRLGIFLLTGAFLITAFILFFAASNLLRKTDTYYVAYNDVSVSGLEVGSPIKYLGITVGSITDIFINPKDVNQIIIELSLKSGTPVKTDATADIAAIGITGLKTIEIRGGTNEAEFLTPQGYINPGTSLVENISGRAEIITYKIEEVLNNLLLFSQPDNIQKIMYAVDMVADLSKNANQSFQLIEAVITENREPFNETLHSAKEITGNTKRITANLESSTTQFNEIMQGDTLSDILSNIRDISFILKEVKIEELIENLAQASIQTQEFILKLDDDLAASTRNLENNL